MKSLLLTMAFFSLLACNHSASNDIVNKGVVSAASPEAAKAGAMILQKGGNAIDAAVAVAFALGVSEPAMSGLGGGTQILMSIPEQEPIAINGTTFSPIATPMEVGDTLNYHRRSTIPSTVKVLDYVWRKYGSGKISWADLLEPAIHLAEEGFVVGSFRHKVYYRYRNALQKSLHHANVVLMPDGSIPAPGDILQQPILANTLRRLAIHGANDFYQGQIAKSIATDMIENDGWITLADLQNFPNPKELPPLQTTYRDFEVYTQPPPCGGWTVLQILHILEKSATEELKLNSAFRLEKLAKALELGHADRANNPIPDLSNYQAFIQEKLDKEYAVELLKKDFKAVPSSEVNGETTHFSVVDTDGIAVAVTASINAYFGAKAAAKDLGFLYNSYMDDFKFGQPDHPYAIAPHRMAYSSMSPTIIRRHGKNVLVIGSPGSKRIISTVAQLSQVWMDEGIDIQDLLRLPRVHVNQKKLYLEDMQLPSKVLDQLRHLGYKIAFPSYSLMQNNRNAYFGGVHAVAFEKEHWVGAADLRRDGAVENVE